MNIYCPVLCVPDSLAWKDPSVCARPNKEEATVLLGVSSQHHSPCC